MKIAFYGKGGIGKSTIAANLSAAWADAGLRVLHIGCDPKSDSTRLLLGRRIDMTVLDYLRRTAPSERRLSDVVFSGYGGVACVEAGGPEPGVGCAGRGILSTFSLLDDLGLAPDSYDAVVYDVLGDVVCGGFAVPLRREFADVVCLVTSGEFMSLYAANNILKGVKNYDDSQRRLAGILLNRRGLKDEKDCVARFAEAVGLPIRSVIPRSEDFRKAEAAEQTLAEFLPGAELTTRLHNLALDLAENRRRFAAEPLADEALERLLLPDRTGIAPPNRRKQPAAAEKTAQAKVLSGLPAPARPPAGGPGTKGYLSKSMLFREPIHGCAFAGALNMTTQVRDAVTVVHGPVSCAHIAAGAIVSSGIRAHRLRQEPVFRQLAPALHVSAIDDRSVIFGAEDTLVERIEEAVGSPSSAVFVAAACPSAIIGEDVHKAVRKAVGLHPPKPVVPITADGNLAGDYMQGVINAAIETAGALIDPNAGSRGRRVNIVAEKNIAANTDENFRKISALLSELGVTVNCRFIRDASTDEIRGFCRAPLNLLAYDDHFGRVLRRFFTDSYGSRFADNPFPVGRFETAAWLREIAAFFGLENQAEALVSSHENRYRQRAERLKKALAGKRLMIVSYNHNVDWLIEAAVDTGMAVAKVGVLNYTQDSVVKTRFSETVPFETGYAPNRRAEDIEALRPHLVLSNYAAADLPETARYDTLPLCPGTGFDSGLVLAARWARVLSGPPVEGWKHDRRLLS